MSAVHDDIGEVDVSLEPLSRQAVVEFQSAVSPPSNDGKRRQMLRKQKSVSKGLKEGQCGTLVFTVSFDPDLESRDSRRKSSSDSVHRKSSVGISHGGRVSGQL